MRAPSEVIHLGQLSNTLLLLLIRTFELPTAETETLDLEAQASHVCGCHYYHLRHAGREATMDTAGSNLRCGQRRGGTERKRKLIY